MQPDSHGLTVLPFLSGERAPGYHGEAHCTITGINPATTTPHLVRAGVEAVVLRLSEIIDIIQLAMDEAKDVDDPITVVASGGVLEGIPLWRSIVADVLNMEVLLPEAAETTSRGVVILVLEGLGIPFDPTPSIISSSIPNKQAHERYMDARARQNALYNYHCLSSQLKEMKAIPW